MNKQSLHAGVVVAGPDGDVLVTYRVDQIQNTSVVLEFMPPKEKTIREDSIVEHTYPHKTCQCPEDPCCHTDPDAGCNKSPDRSEADESAN